MSTFFTHATRKTQLLMVAAGSATIIVAGVGFTTLTGGQGGPVHEVNGMFILYDFDFVASFTPQAECAGSGDYSDIRNGTSVTIRNNSGKKISSGKLTDAVGVKPKPSTGDAVIDGLVSACMFNFTTKVPDSGSFRVEIANRTASSTPCSGGRCGVTEVAASAADFAADDWRPVLSLGPMRGDGLHYEPLGR